MGIPRKRQETEKAIQRQLRGTTTLCWIAPRVLFVPAGPSFGMDQMLSISAGGSRAAKPCSPLCSDPACLAFLCSCCECLGRTESPPSYLEDVRGNVEGPSWGSEQRTGGKVYCPEAGKGESMFGAISLQALLGGKWKSVKRKSRQPQGIS